MVKFWKFFCYLKNGVSCKPLTLDFGLEKNTNLCSRDLVRTAKKRDKIQSNCFEDATKKNEMVSNSEVLI